MFGFGSNCSLWKECCLTRDVHFVWGWLGQFVFTDTLNLCAFLPDGRNASYVLERCTRPINIWWVWNETTGNSPLIGLGEGLIRWKSSLKSCQIHHLTSALACSCDLFIHWNFIIIFSKYLLGHSSNWRQIEPYISKHINLFSVNNGILIYKRNYYEKKVGAIRV